MSARAPRLVLFDLDGTLVDSAPDLAFCINAMLKRLGRSLRTEAQVREWIGSGAERLVKRALAGDLQSEPEASLYDTAYALFSDLYAENTSRASRLYPGVREGLDYLLASGRRLGCITNKRARYTEPLLTALGILGDFAIVVSGDSLPGKKPDPLPLLHAARCLGVAPEEVLMVGDSVNDVLAARAAGTAVFCVRYGYNNGADIAEARPDALLGSLAELATLI